MIERIVIVPDVDNAGTSLETERAAIENELLTLAGGYTSDRVRGVWRGPDGATYRDESTRYTVDVDAPTDAALLARLPSWCAALRQEALYTSASERAVSFVTAPAAAA